MHRSVLSVFKSPTPLSTLVATYLLATMGALSPECVYLSLSLTVFLAFFSRCPFLSTFCTVWDFVHVAVCGLSPLQVYLSVDFKILLGGSFKLLALDTEIVVDNPVAVSGFTERKISIFYVLRQDHFFNNFH